MSFNSDDEIIITEDNYYEYADFLIKLRTKLLEHEEQHFVTLDIDFVDPKTEFQIIKNMANTHMTLNEYLLSVIRKQLETSDIPLLEEDT